MLGLQLHHHLPSLPLLHQLLKNDFLTISMDRERGIVHIVRSPVRFTTAAECDRIYAEAARAVSILDRPRLGLLIDLRDAPLTQDSDIERCIGGHRKRIISGYSKVAILVRTAAGGLQVSRHSREDGIRVAVFQTEENARAYLAF
jgi:hypothetical protein